MSLSKISEVELDNIKIGNDLKSVHVIRFNDESALDYDTDYPTQDFVFKKVGFDVLASSAAMGQDNPIRAVKMQMESCLLWGDKQLLFDAKDATVFTSVMQQFVKITEQRTATLKKN